MAPAREFVILLAFALVLMSSLLNHHQFLARFHMGHSVEGLLKICSISSAPPLPGIIVLQELSLRLSIFQFRSVSINSLWLEARKRRLTCVAGV